MCLTAGTGLQLTPRSPQAPSGVPLAGEDPPHLVLSVLLWRFRAMNQATKSLPPSEQLGGPLSTLGGGLQLCWAWPGSSHFFLPVIH